jgi:hypothetical protein
MQRARALRAHIPQCSSLLHCLAVILPPEPRPPVASSGRGLPSPLAPSHGRDDTIGKTRLQVPGSRGVAVRGSRPPAAGTITSDHPVRQPRGLTYCTTASRKIAECWAFGSLTSFLRTISSANRR